MKPLFFVADAVPSNPTLGKIVYYLRFAAASLGVQALNAGAGADAAANAFLNELVNRIDADKQKYGVIAEQEDDDIAFLTKYAMGLFKRSDDSDRAGASDQAVGQTFATVGFLLDAVRHVAKEPDARLAQVAKYAKGRAADIILALKEGRAPPPPAGGVDLFAELGACAAAAAGQLRGVSATPHGDCGTGACSRGVGSQRCCGCTWLSALTCGGEAWRRRGRCNGCPSTCPLPLSPLRHMHPQPCSFSCMQP